jgi:hypothetical protein
MIFISGCSKMVGTPVVVMQSRHGINGCEIKILKTSNPELNVSDDPGESRMRD